MSQDAILQARAVLRKYYLPARSLTISECTGLLCGSGVTAVAPKGLFLTALFQKASSKRVITAPKPRAAALPCYLLLPVTRRSVSRRKS